MLKTLSHPFVAELKRRIASQNSLLGPIILSISEIIPTTKSSARVKQHKLSEVTDLIHAAHVFHRCIFENAAHRDNVMSSLVGDYLLAQSSLDMADMRLPRTVGLIAKGLEDYTIGEFELLRDQREIERHAELTCGSLMANACLSASLLAGQTEKSDWSKMAFNFGHHTGTAQRLLEISNDDQDLTADKRLLNQLANKHLDHSIAMLNKDLVPESKPREQLLSLVDKMRSRIP